MSGMAIDPERASDGSPSRKLRTMEGPADEAGPEHTPAATKSGGHHLTVMVIHPLRALNNVTRKVNSARRRGTISTGAMHRGSAYQVRDKDLNGVDALARKSDRPQDRQYVAKSDDEKRDDLRWRVSQMHARGLRTPRGMHKADRIGLTDEGVEQTAKEWMPLPKKRVAPSLGDIIDKASKRGAAAGGAAYPGSTTSTASGI
jgi:hypothetical protein